MNDTDVLERARRRTVTWRVAILVAVAALLACAAALLTPSAGAAPLHHEWQQPSLNAPSGVR